MRLAKRKTTIAMVIILIYSVLAYYVNTGSPSSLKHLRETSDDYPNIIEKSNSNMSLDHSHIQLGQGSVDPSSHRKTSFGHRHIQLRKGSFRPSLSLLTRKFVRVEDIAPYNEFEYEHFNISEPMFVREEDRLMFYNFTTGLDLLQPAPYVKRRGVVEVIRNGSYSESFLCGWPSNYSDMRVKSIHKGTAHFKKLCPLLTPEGHTFQHFIDGLLPKLMQVRDILLDPEMKLLIPFPRYGDKNFINSVIERIGLSKDQIVQSEDKHFTADWMVASCITPPIHPVLWRTARAILGVPTLLPVPLKDAYVVMLTRSHSYNGGRHLINQKAVVGLLKRRYGASRVVVFKGGYSFNESLSLFGRTRLIIGVHGGALYNLNFAPQNAIVLELMPYDHYENDYPPRLAHTIFWSMSNLIGQQFWRIYIKGHIRTMNVKLDTGILETALTKIDKNFKIR